MPNSLLYVLNVSNPDRLSSDSGWIFASVLLPALVDAGLAVSLACPVALPDPRVATYPVSVPDSKYRARFSLDIAEMAAVITAAGPEVVFVNQLETAPAMRAAMLESGRAAVLAGYCHYLPFHLDPVGRIVVDPAMDDGGLGMPVVLAFLAGVQACDRVLVHSRTSYDWLRGAAAQLGLDLGDRLRVVAPPRDPRVVRPGVLSPPPGEVAVYNHRLYAHYGTGRFVELARRLLAAGATRIRVMDLMGTRRSGRVSLDPSPERYRRELAALTGVELCQDQGDRARYRALLADARFALAPFRPACIWSMSVIDCQAMGVPVIAPRMGWLIEGVDDELLFDDPDQALQIAHRLRTDPAFWIRHARRARAATEALTPTASAAAFTAALP